MNRVDVAIIGAGVTGLSTAFHLKSLGLESMAVFEDPASQVSSLLCPGMAFGGLMDNYTRIEHAYGRHIARDVWGFSHLAFEKLVGFLNAQGAKLRRVRRLRLLVREDELAEARQATDLLLRDGFSTRFMAGHGEFSQGILGDRVLGLQEDMEGAAVFKPEDLRRSLLTEDVASKVIQRRVKRLEVGPKEVAFEAASGERWGSQMVVLAAHGGIAKLSPFFEDVLIPYADQWHQMTVRESGCPEVVYSAHHGYEWGHIGTDTAWIGGGRFLRPMAGISQPKAEVSDKAYHYLKRGWSGLWPSCALGRAQLSRSFFGLRPCDELPLIGPMFGENRLLLGAGYMGLGLAAGFAAGQALAELIYHGRCFWLPRMLEPRRLRALEH